MSREVRDSQGRVWAATNSSGQLVCVLCGCPLQRTGTGDLADGVAAHYKTVHPKERQPR